MTAFDEGYAARSAGRGRDQNPYHRPDDRYYAWREGWDAADDELARYA